MQGLWWDPSRSGNGFEIFNASHQVAVLWFTCTGAGRPTWYTAVGRRDGLGTEAWPLLEHRWSVLMGKRGSDSALLKKHHAFSALSRPDGSLSIAIPARIHDGTRPPATPSTTRGSTAD